MDVEDLIERLCVAAGMIMEDASVSAISTEGEPRERILKLLHASEAITALAHAAEVLTDIAGRVIVRCAPKTRRSAHPGASLKPAVRSVVH